jgi:hypothetical protein
MSTAKLRRSEETMHTGLIAALWSLIKTLGRVCPGYGGVVYTTRCLDSFWNRATQVLVFQKSIPGLVGTLGESESRRRRYRMKREEQ